MLDSIKNIFSKSAEENNPVSSGTKPDIKREHSADLFEKAKKYFPIIQKYVKK